MIKINISQAIFRATPLSVFLVVLGYVFYLGAISVDFGRHWDEFRILNSLQASYTSGLFLPRWYNYPSLTYDLAVLTTLPKALHLLLGSEANTNFAPLITQLGGEGFKIHLRLVCFGFSLGSSIAVYFFTSKFCKNAYTGLFAALALITSWEFIYHARWIAPDVLLASMVSFSLLSQYLLLNSKGRLAKTVYLAVASLMAGLCIGTKYPGGIVLVPLMIAIYQSKFEESRALTTLLLMLFSAVVVSFSFLLTTPGSLLEPFKFYSDVLIEMEHYRTGHGGHTVAPGFDHFSLLMLYLLSQVASKYVLLAATSSVFALLGVVWLFKERRDYALWFLSAPVLYIVYMSVQSAMVVRNYMMLLPFIFILTAFGVLFVYRMSSDSIYSKFLVIGCSIFFLGHNLMSISNASHSIEHPNETPMIEALVEHLKTSPDTPYYLSPQAKALLDRNENIVFRNYANQLDRADAFIFISSEPSDWKLYPANVRGRYRTIWSKMEEVNWDYYPSWIGNPRLIQVDATDPKLRPLMNHIIKK